MSELDELVSIKKLHSALNVSIPLNVWVWAWTEYQETAKVVGDDCLLQPAAAKQLALDYLNFRLSEVMTDDTELLSWVPRPK